MDAYVHVGIRTKTYFARKSNVLWFGTSILLRNSVKNVKTLMLEKEPNFILLDEPLAGIDTIALGEIRDLISHLKDRGIGVLITDHNVRETLDIVDRAYILHDGTVLMEGAPSEIVSHQEVRRFYLGDRFKL